MLEVVIKIFGVVFASITGALIIRVLLKEKIEINLKNILLLLILSIITSIQFQTTYKISITLITYIVITFIYKLIFNISFKKSVLTSGVMLCVIIIIDMFWSLILLHLFSLNDIRNNVFYFTLTNILIYSNAYIFASIPILQNILNKFITKIDDSKIYSQYIFIILTIVILCLIGYDLASTPMTDIDQYINIFVIFVLMLILILIYIKSKNDNDKLQEQFDYLYNYSKNYEDWITKEQLNIHENKNQLIVLRDMVKKNEKAVNYINEILEEDFVIEDKWIGQLSNIPKGGLKGLLYYKLITIEKNNLNFCVDISKNVKNKLKKIQKEQLKDISHIIGIFMDNAIEASVNSKKKMFSLELYCIKKELNIVITNSFDGQIELNKINNNGYSTKGKGRGKGLYFVSKIKEKNPNILTEAHIINNYFVQKIIIK